VYLCWASNEEQRQFDRSFNQFEVLRKKYSYVTFEVFTAVTNVRRLLVEDNVVPNSPTFVTLMTEALRSSETSCLTRVTRCKIPEDGILQEYRL
jgi:hypothetical protein